MAKIVKPGDADKVTLEMTMDEIVMLQGIVERAANVSARAAHCTHHNSLAHEEAQIAMKAMWSFSDNLSVPTDPKAGYIREFRLP